MNVSIADRSTFSYLEPNNQGYRKDVEDERYY